MARTIQKLLRAFERLGVQAYGLDQTRYRLANRYVVSDHEYNGRPLFPGGAPPLDTGKVN